MKALRLIVGECIYCGDCDSKLTREHVLPRGLGGNESPAGASSAFVLQEASCEKCRRTTQKMEEDCLRHMMDPARARLGLKRKDRTGKTTKAQVVLEDGSSTERDLPWHEVPGPIILPSFHEALIFSGNQASDLAPCDYEIIVVAPATAMAANKRSKVGVTLTANARRFAQLLAKIALGVAVARYGPKGFEPFVRDFILDKPGSHGRWVGGFAQSKEKGPLSKEFHAIRQYEKPGPVGTFIFVEIRLFAEFGGPTNYVVVGRLLR